MQSQKKRIGNRTVVIFLMAGFLVPALSRIVPTGNMVYAAGGCAGVPPDDQAHALVLQPDGKLVAAGSAVNSTFDDFALVRYNANGSLDTTFGAGGKVTTSFTPSNDSARALVLQPDGKIIVAGGTADLDFALARYNANGSMDPAFGVGGKVTTSFPGGSAGAYALALQADGRMIAVGSGFANNDFELARYNADGSLDMTFGTGGRVSTQFGSPAEGLSMILQTDSKIVVAGRLNGLTPSFAVARYNMDGSLDSGFGASGLETVPGGYATALAVQTDGKIVAAGRSALVRFNPNGTLDESFGTGGIVIPNFNVVALVLQTDGKIITAGSVTVNVYDSDFAVARYNTDGSLDTTFGSGGRGVTPITTGDDSVSALVLLADGKIVAAGTVFPNNSDSDFVLVRYNTDGSQDTAFGSIGKVTTSIGTGFGCSSVSSDRSGGGGVSFPLGSNCFIATAASGSYLDPDIQAVRDFRDKYLLTHPAGRLFVRWYYSYSPPLAALLVQHEDMKIAARIALSPVVYVIRYPLILGVFLLATLSLAGYLARKSYS